MQNNIKKLNNLSSLDSSNNHKEIQNFFEHSIKELAEKFSYTSKDREDFLQKHAGENMLDLLVSKDYFLQTIRDENQKIIGYIESSEHKNFANIEIINRLLIDENADLPLDFILKLLDEVKQYIKP